MADLEQQPYLRPGVAGATLTVDLGALRSNYLKLNDLCGATECAAAVKGDAYGTGVARVVETLSKAGCKTFFVAQLSEAVHVRAALPQAIIYVLNGLVFAEAGSYADMRLRPVLGTVEEIAEWSQFCRARGKRLPAAVHVDTGINRLGLTQREVETLSSAPELAAGFDWALTMSHLACADDPAHPMNNEQLARFNDLRARLPKTDASLANSGGTLIDKAYHYDLVRPGVALYGGNPSPPEPNPMQPVVRLDSLVLQVREVAAGSTVGYGAKWRAQRPSKIAVVPIGYYDGYFRSLFDTHADDQAGVYIEGQFAPLAGRVSMDMITVDVTDIAGESVQRGTKVEIIGPNISVDDVARWAGTIPYEVLTALGSRYARVYVN